MNKIKVLIIDDSPLFRQFLCEGLSKYEYIEIVGTASDPFDARNKIKELKPDVISCDIEMPHMDGITFVKKLMQTYPIRVIIVSALHISVFDAVSAGAVDFLRKPEGLDPEVTDVFIEDLADSILVASQAKLKMLNIKPENDRKRSFSHSNFKRKDTGAKQVKKKRAGIKSSTLIAIGASTGGTEAVLDIMTRLPADTPGVLIVQHMPAGFTKMYAERLNKICQMEVREAKNGDEVEQGVALIAPGDFQMSITKINGKYKVRCLSGEKVSGHRPSVDVLFSSVADIACPNAIGVILTGMGGDGAKGLLEMKNFGAYTIGQDEASCVVYGMPMVAYKMGAVTKQAPLENIPELILSHLAKM
jgi:two-component system chemotaxis response regulator CheB